MATSKRHCAVALVLVAVCFAFEGTWATSVGRKNHQRKFRMLPDLPSPVSSSAIEPTSVSELIRADTGQLNGTTVSLVSEVRAASPHVDSGVSALGAPTILQSTDSGAAELHVSSLEITSTQANPWSKGEYKNFISRFNVPEVHMSGVYVDLGKSDLGYRQVAGMCPIFGKFIKLLKPGSTTKTFLEDFPNGGSSARPLPGGFNLATKGSSSGRPFSPVKDSFIRSSLGSASPKTELGRCARYASMMEPIKPGTNSRIAIKLPFVYDASAKECYVLHVAMQQLRGSRYCSTDGIPPGLPWPCFHPEKSHTSSTHLVYGSGYMGAASIDADAWESKCPNKAVRDALFGEWVNGTCKVFGSRSRDSIVVTVTSKEECWETVFLKSATDEAVQSNSGSWDSIWPSLDSAASLSRGSGYNYANFYPGTNSCVIFSRVPSCFLKAHGKTAYTALGSLEEEQLPEGVPIWEGGEEANEADKEGEGNTWVIAGGVLGGLVLLGAGAGGAVYYKQHAAGPPLTEAAPEHHIDPGEAGKTRNTSEANVQLEESFWKGESQLDP